jgi:predicted MFS family arabinose efflux permease
LAIAELKLCVAIAAVLLAIWGFIGTAAPVAWWTWVTRAEPDNPEAGGALMVAGANFPL